MASLEAAHLPILPTSGPATVSLTGHGTAWTSGTPGSPTFALSGGSGASIASQSVQDNAHATLVISGGTAAGNLTITDPSTGATATVQVRPRARWCPPRRGR